MKKRILSLFLAILMLCTLLPVSAFAEGETQISSVSVEIEDPIPGMTVSSCKVTVPDNANYSVSDVYWYNQSNGNTDMSSNQKFEMDTAYYVVVYLTPNQGSAFAGAANMQGTVNGKNVTVAAYGQNDDIVILSDTLYSAGRCGNNLSWGIDENGTLTISGTGDMYDFDTSDNTPPWFPYKQDIIKKIVIENGVTSIGNYAFRSIGNITSMEIPGSVTRIGEYAFEYFSSLANLTLNTGLTTIGNNAFRYCGKLESLTIPSSVTTIGARAFGNCYSIKEVSIPAGVSAIGESAFYDGRGLESINVASDNANYCSVNGVLFDKAQATLLQYPGGKTATSYSIPDTVTTIGANAFYNCDNLTEMTIPSQVTNINNSAFAACDKLSTVTVLANVKAINPYVFEGCSALKTVTLPSSLTDIYRGAFNKCSSLTDIYYHGTENEWDEIIKSDNENDYLFSAELHYILPESIADVSANIVAPQAGMIPSYEVSLPNGAHYYRANYNDSSKGIKNGIVWSNETDGYWLVPGEEAFETGKVYHVCIYLNTESGYAFDFGNMEATVINKPAVTASSGKQLMLQYTFTAVPNTPAFTIANNTTTGKPKLSMTAEDGIMYEISRATSQSGAYDVIGSANSGSYIDTTAAAGKTYYYKVTAVTKDGSMSEASAAKSATCKPAAPAISITTSAGKPKLTWKAVTGADKYYIYRSTDGKTYSYLTGTSKLTYTNTGAKVGTKYYYKVKAIKVVDDTKIYSSFSNAKSVTCKPAAPTISITTSAGKPKLSWKAVTGAEKYYIYRSTDGKTYSYLTSTSKLTYTNTGAKVGTKYYYKVKAVDTGSGTNIYSAYSSAKSITCKPAAPSGVSITATSTGKPKLSWKAVTGADKYFIYRTTDGTNYSYLTSTTKLTYTDTKATAGKTCFYKVKAVKVVNGTNVYSAYSSAVKLTVK